ncbi:DUF2971 domain-containing protein [Gordonia terrae]|uniref:DUF2971 domain-containing protein n=1 Tax=Gordonia hongkongensis TaxID=1701090 RepID=UPI0022B3EDC8|nr:DUF2971 domain-containing protein [Gordonia terrae]
MTDVDVPATLPPNLYHYTDSGGLQGILGPGKGPYQLGGFHNKDVEFRYRGDLDLYTNGKAALFRATDVRYMNDSQELVFGAKIVSERLRAAAGHGDVDVPLRTAFLSFAHFFDPERVFEWPARCFAVCFCGNGDVLSQWRGYAGGVGGFAIGFPREVLAQRSWGIHIMAAGNISDLPSPAPLVQVAYGEDDSRARADDLIDVIKSRYAQGDLLRDPDGSPGLAVSMAAFQAIAGMKHSAFAEEQEWRLLAVTSQTGREVRTRPTAAGIVPYMDVVVNARLRVDTNEVVEAPLAEVVVGPAEPAQSRGQIAAVGDLLRSRGMWGFRDVPVVPSKAPFRS